MNTATIFVVFFSDLLGKTLASFLLTQEWFLVDLATFPVDLKNWWLCFDSHMESWFPWFIEEKDNIQLGMWTEQSSLLSGRERKEERMKEEWIDRYWNSYYYITLLIVLQDRNIWAALLWWLLERDLTWFVHCCVSGT